MDKQQLLQELKSEGFPDYILKAFEKIERELFIPKHLKLFAYKNEPLPIGEGSTISQPYTIAFMLNLLELDKLINNKFVTNKINKQDSSSKQNKPAYQDKLDSQKNEKFDITNNKNSNKNIKILEIGSGSGYVLALINEILPFSRIYGVEINKELVEKSSKLFKKNKKIKVIHGDGSKGLSKYASYDRILVSAAFEKIPENLFSQLKEDGILVSPVRNSIFQFKKQNGKIKQKEFPGFVFVPVV